MHMLLVKFHSGLPDADVLARMDERLPQFRAVPGLIQKYYAREAATGDYCGVYLFDSEGSLLAYRNSELAKGIPPIYQLQGGARVEVMELLYPLHPERMPAAADG
jgi:hypothetical protein